MGWKRSRRQNVLKGMAAGAIGGLAGAFVMNQSGKAISGVMKGRRQEQTALEGQQGGAHNYPENYGRQEQESEDATQKAAQKVATFVHHPLNQKQKKYAGPVVHYLFGAVVGAAYGAAAEKLPVNKVVGLPFGAVLWATADELAVPKLGLSKPFRAYPPAAHLNALANHAVYGLTTEMVRRGLRKVI